MNGGVKPLRYLGVDPGARRIGLALSTPEGIVSALKIVAGGSSPDQTAQLLLQTVEEFAADAVVIGLPFNMDGTEGPQARVSRTLAEALRRAAPDLIIYLHDERLTSDAADRELDGRSLTRRQKKSRQDAVAARVLLESFLCGVEPDAF